MPAGTPVALGFANGDAELTTVGFNTGAAIPDGALMVLGVGYYNNTTPSATIGGQALTLGDVFQNPLDSNDRVAILRAIASGAKSSGVAATVTFSGAGAFGRTVAGCYVPQVASATPTSNGGNSAATSGWDSGAATAGTADGIVIGYAKIVFRTTTSTEDANTDDIVDTNDATANTTWVLAKRDVTSNASVAVGGTWADSGTAWVATHEVFEAVADDPVVIQRSRPLIR